MICRNSHDICLEPNLQKFLLLYPIVLCVCLRHIYEGKYVKTFNVKCSLTPILQALSATEEWYYSYRIIYAMEYLESRTICFSSLLIFIRINLFSAPARIHNDCDEGSARFLRRNLLLVDQLQKKRILDEDPPQSTNHSHSHGEDPPLVVSHLAYDLCNKYTTNNGTS